MRTRTLIPCMEHPDATQGEVDVTLGAFNPGVMCLGFTIKGRYVTPPSPFPPVTIRREYIQTQIARGAEWFHRVKKWQVSARIPSGPGSEFGAVVFDITSALAVPPLAEDDWTPKLFSNQISFSNGGFSPADVGDRSISYAATMDLFTRRTEEVPPEEVHPYEMQACNNPATDTMLISFRFSLSLSVYDNATFEEWIATTDSWDSLEWDEFTDEPGTLDAINFPLRWPWIGFTNGGSVYIESAPIVEITPIEWWAFAGEPTLSSLDDGDAIWDTTTGSQLKDLITGADLPSPIPRV